MEKSKENIEDFRCPCCRRLLFKAKAVLDAEIKCPKCKKLVNIKGIAFNQSVKSARIEIG